MEIFPYIRERIIEGFKVSLDRLFDELPSISFKENLSAISYLEKMLIIKALERKKGNQKRAAELLGINRNSLARRMEKYGIKKEMKLRG